MTSHAETKEIVEKGYDTIADKYFAWSSPRPTTTRAEYIKNLGELLSKGASVLELGCGNGVPATRQMVAAGLKVTGVDISIAQVKLAREHVPEATFVQGDMMSLSYEPGSFDAVVAFYSLFHIRKEDQGTMVANIRSWVKDGGYILFNLRYEEGDVNWADWMGAPMFSSGLGVEGSRNMIQKELEGLTIIDDRVDVEKVGRFEEKFHWVFAVNKGQNA